MADWAEDWTKRRVEETRAEIHGTSLEPQTGAAGLNAVIAACPHKKGSSFPGKSQLIMLEDPQVTRDQGLREVVCYFEKVDPATGTGGGGGDEELTDEQKLALP